MIPEFLKFAEFLKSNPTTTVLAILLALSSFAAYNSIQNGNLLKILAPRPEKEVALFARSLKASEDIAISLDNLRASTGADRVLIRQFHNGRYDLTGIPFTSVSVTYMSSDEKYENTHIFESKPLAFMGSTARVMWSDIDAPKCVVYHQNIPDIGLRTELADSNRSVICPLVSLLKYPVGTISLHYTESSSNLTDQALIARTEDVAVTITGYLNEKRD
jgi:hypothetical protein